MIPPPLSAHETTDRLFGVLKSIGEFDTIEIRGIINILINPDPRATCFRLIYHRTVANVASLLALNTKQHVQAISMITRSLFELAIDIDLIEKISDSIPKIMIYAEYEKLRRAKQILAYKAANPSVDIHVAIYEGYIKSNESRLDASKSTLWPDKASLITGPI